jgi:hypothetical protein
MFIHLQKVLPRYPKICPLIFKSVPYTQFISTPVEVYTVGAYNSMLKCLLNTLFIHIAKKTQILAAP